MSRKKVYPFAANVYQFQIFSFYTLPYCIILIATNYEGHGDHFDKDNNSEIIDLVYQIDLFDHVDQLKL